MNWITKLEAKFAERENKINILENNCNKMQVIKADKYKFELKTYEDNKLRSQKSEIAQWKNDKRKIDEESL